MNIEQEKPRWADVQDTPPSQDVHPSLPNADETLRFSQASQESVDLDGSREALRAQLERGILLATPPDSFASQLRAQHPSSGGFVETTRRLQREASILVTASCAAASSTDVLGSSTASSLPSPSRHRFPLECSTPEVRSRWKHLEANLEASSADNSKTPPRTTANKRGHAKQSTGANEAATATPSKNKRARNCQPDSAEQASPLQSTPTREMPKKRQTGGQKPKENKENEDAQKREHRRNGRDFIKRSTEYQTFHKLREQESSMIAPRTPDPEDLSLSKRVWEKKVQTWRDALRRGCRDHNEEPIEDC